MRKDRLRKLSKKESFAIIGLHPKDEETYFLANLVIVLKDNGLNITTVSGRIVNEPDDTYFTDQNFIFTYNSKDYILKNENNELVVYEKEEIIGSSIS